MFLYIVFLEKCMRLVRQGQTEGNLSDGIEEAQAMMPINWLWMEPSMFKGDHAVQIIRRGKYPIADVWI